ncbi:hypothetical protein [Dyadobacter sp. CY323]|uniref:hypothetical protein n=1 Tax=Dyadobacter sp. CY323 TaxID=2907302 RepID=UPI001F2A65BB|nr:hypothetical protein [Dyadobacter sp. CY323]MCE6987457.1 hypothetical protein [Dyadobacter sp. CY323]
MCARIMVLFIGITLVLVGCTKEKMSHDPTEPNQDVTEVPVTPIVTDKFLGDIGELRITPYARNLQSGFSVYSSPLRFDKWLERPTNKPEYGRIVAAGTSIEMIVIGGSLSAGVKDGGLSREGQLGCYSNLVATQLGMIDFVTPVFEEPYSNGTGFDIRMNRSELFFNRVNNDLAILQAEAHGNPPVLRPFKGPNVSNFSVPWLTTWDIFAATWDSTRIGKGVNAFGVSWAPFLPYAWRFVPRAHFEQGTFYQHIRKTQSYNFYLLEDRGDYFLNAIRMKRPISQGALLYDMKEGEYHTLRLIKMLSYAGQKGVIMTVPRLRDLGITDWNVTVLNTNESQMYDTAVEINNGHFRKWAAEHDLALVDLENLYSDINNGRYTTEQGLKITGGLSGNFFSSDGIYPTTLGQAVIANEVIKAINIQYNSKIPLVDIRSYMSTIGVSID